VHDIRCDQVFWTHETRNSIMARLDDRYGERWPKEPSAKQRATKCGVCFIQRSCRDTRQMMIMRVIPRSHYRIERDPPSSCLNEWKRDFRC
jgi:hypothetical protein